MYPSVVAKSQNGITALQTFLIKLISKSAQITPSLPSDQSRGGGEAQIESEEMNYDEEQRHWEMGGNVELQETICTCLPSGE